jgi:hypothetical protein
MHALVAWSHRCWRRPSNRPVFDVVGQCWDGGSEVRGFVHTVGPAFVTLRINASRQLGLQTHWRSQRDRRMVILLEKAICTHELTQTCKLAAGAEYVGEEAALAELYRILQIAHPFQTHRTYGLTDKCRK